MVPTLPYKGLMNMLITCHTNNVWFFKGRFGIKNKGSIGEGDFISTEKIHVSEPMEKQLTVNHGIFSLKKFLSKNPFSRLDSWISLKV